MLPLKLRMLALGALLATLAMSGCASYWLLYPGMAESHDPHLNPADSGQSYATISVTNAGGYKLIGWIFANAGDHGTLLVAGGNAQNLSSTYSVSRYLIGNGFRVLIFTYQGFDQNGGPADLASLIGDAQAFYSYVQSQYKGEPIAFAGYSTGAVAGICLSDREPLSAIAAEGTFNPKTVVEDKHLWAAMPLNAMFKSDVPDELNTSRCLQESKAASILFVHNPADPMVPYDSARRLYDGYQGQKQFLDTKTVPGTDAHFGSVSDPEARAKILAFLKQHLA
ncbi:MAG TPA: hypothetical protein VJX23_07865 [Candidatus Binataceae bacterium]|nr:hypothetical protein [Candidatus Binataceae bacterium]